jgi:putative endonuclease
MESRDTGFRGEDLACRYLQKKGYHILARNYQGGKCELDIVAETGDIVVFCEVKTALNDRYGSPLEWVTPAKIRNIARAAREYITANEIRDRCFRFDVIGIEVREGKPEITHLENAFMAPAHI